MMRTGLLTKVGTEERAEAIAIYRRLLLADPSTDNLVQLDQVRQLLGYAAGKTNQERREANRMLEAIGQAGAVKVPSVGKKLDEMEQRRDELVQQLQQLEAEMQQLTTPVLEQLRTADRLAADFKLTRSGHVRTAATQASGKDLAEVREKLGQQIEALQSLADRRRTFATWRT